jgi:hypothetical protein
MTISHLAGAAAAGALLALGPASARADALLYDNGADLFSSSPETINKFHAVTDEFTLSAAATIDKVVFAEAVLGTSTPLTIDWCVGSSPFGGSCVKSATISATSTSTGGAFGHWSSTFSLPDLPLSAGTYYLTLSNGTDTPLSNPNFAHDNDYWAVSDHTPVDAQLLTLSSPPPTTVSSDVSFQIYGTAGSSGGGGGGGTGVPEPQTLWLLAAGTLLTLGFARRRWSAADYRPPTGAPTRA